ncbi:MAG: hypothetical protein DWQ37_13820 [Planctomycetota bacterium]|nr:MAG: hypothetical protein DWQ37_13820 [Planctomycetota bacterium]
MRRLNVKLALWLVGITVFSVVGVHFLHGYQVKRNAEGLKLRAEQARKDGDINEAISTYNQFLRYRDDREGYKALAELVVEVANEADATRRDKVRAYSILEEAIRRHPDLDEVRTSLVDYTLGMRRWGDTLEHINTIQANRAERNEPPDTELVYKAALCKFLSGDEREARKDLYEIVGYDETSGTFTDERPEMAGEVDAYRLLAEILSRGTTEDKDLASQVMRQIVVWNPDSAKAHLTLAQYLMGQWQAREQSGKASTIEERDAREALLAEATSQVRKAEEIDPKDADVMLTSAGLEIMTQRLRFTRGEEPDYARAQQLLDRALAEHPANAQVYLRRSDLARSRGDLKTAAAELEAGLEKADETGDILKQLVEAKFELRDFDAVRALCSQMREVQSIPLELIKFQEARLKLSDNEIVEGTRELEQVRPAMERLSPQYDQAVNAQLGRCYEMLGRPDKQLEVYRRLLSKQPTLVEGQMGRASALQALGRHEEAESSVAVLVNAALSNAFQQNPSVLPRILQLAIGQEAAKPVDERNWRRVDAMQQLLASSGLQRPLEQELLNAELLIIKGKPDEAKQILFEIRQAQQKQKNEQKDELTAEQKEQEKQDEQRVLLTSIKAMAADPDSQSKLKLALAEVEKRVGMTPDLFRQHVQMVARGDAEKATEELKELEAKLSEFEEEQRPGLLMQLGAAYSQAGDYDNGQRCFMSALSQSPRDGRLRKLVFEMALDRDDKAAMDEILKELRESPQFGSEDPLYKYCVASRNVRQYSRNRVEKKPVTEKDHELLSQSRRLIDEALLVRGEWAPLHRVKGEVEQLDKNIEGAISAYQDSLRFSQSNQAGTAKRLVTLLYEAERYTEANQAMKLLAGTELTGNMRKLVQDNLQRSGNPQEALEMAQQDAEKEPTPSNYIWLGQLLEKDGQTEKAEQAFQNAIRAAPKLTDAWVLYVGRLVSNQKKNKAVEAVRLALKYLGEEPLVLGALHHMTGDLEQAETLYKQALDKNPNDLKVMRQMAQMYFATNRVEEGFEYLDRIIEQGSKSSDEDASNHVAWARRSKAQGLATSGGYQEVMQAIEMVKTNAQDGKLPVADKLTVVGLLGNRNDPSSRAKTIELLEELQVDPGLNARQLTALGKLYNANGDWEKAKTTMQAAVDSRSEDPEVHTLLAEMYFEHDDISNAETFTKNAEDLIAEAPSSYPERVRVSARLMRAKLLKAEGNEKEAVALLEDLLPRPLPQNQLSRLDSLAKQMEQLGLYEGAEGILEEYVSLDPRGKIAMAAFQGRRGNIDKAFALLQESRNSEPAIQVLPVANEILRLYPDAATPERFKLLEGWAQSATETQTNPQRVKLLLAELYDMQGRYDEVEKIYREVLADPNTRPIDKAQVENNLAFILTIANPTPERGAEALELVESAIDYLGPLSDLLDTRALAHLAKGDTEQAAKDLRLAAADRPSTIKYYHLAQVEKRLGNMDAARDALAKAEELHGEHNPFTPLEREGFKQLQQELN